MHVCTVWTCVSTGCWLYYTASYVTEYHEDATTTSVIFSVVYIPHFHSRSRVSVFSSCSENLEVMYSFLVVLLHIRIPLALSYINLVTISCLTEVMTTTVGAQRNWFIRQMDTSKDKINLILERWLLQWLVHVQHYSTLEWRHWEGVYVTNTDTSLW